MPRSLSSILVGTAQGCSCTNYVPPRKKVVTLDSSDLTRARRLNAIGATTPLPTANYGQRPFDYQELQDIQYGNRVRVPLNIMFGQNFQ
jgi:hypothetical protein